MDSSADLTLFQHLTDRPEAELDLAQAALLIAEAEYPGLDLARYVERLDELGEAARARAAGTEAAGERATAERLDAVLGLLYQELGFRGDDQDYYHPRNSFLNEVLDRRRGIPITLALVLLETCARTGIVAHGVSFPSHFLVRVPAPDGPRFIDPFSGRLLDRADLRGLYEKVSGRDEDPDPRLLEPAPKRHVLLRLLNNLRGIYEARSDHARLRGILERVMILAPSEELRAELEGLRDPPALTPRN